MIKTCRKEQEKEILYNKIESETDIESKGYL